MSAYQVSNDTIDYLVTASRLWRLASDGYLPSDARNLTDSELGQILIDENVRSVNARYNEQKSADGYVYKPVNLDSVSAVNVLKSVQCLNYQSCETDDWETTPAHAICQATAMPNGAGRGRRRKRCAHEAYGPDRPRNGQQRRMGQGGQEILPTRQRHRNRL